MRLDLTGQQFGSWKVFTIDTARTSKRRSYWRARCVCGVERSVLAEALRSGKSTSCGCVHRLQLEGRTFGQLTVQRRDDTRRPGYWLVRCSCGAERSVYYGHLTTGRQVSCGCRKRLARSTHEPGVLDLGRGRLAFVSPRDAQRVAPYCWCLDAAGYPAATICGRRVRLHVFLRGRGVDHRDGDKLNNRRENLRRCSLVQNAWNQRLRRTNRSGFKGVDRYVDGRWRARIRAHGVTTFLGYFQTADEAARAYDDAARMQHGEFARLNFP